MLAYPDRDCAHLRCDYTPTVINNEIVGSRITNWCCDLNGDQSCGTGDCPTDRGRYAAVSQIRRESVLERKGA